MENLTKENFWNEMTEKYPIAMDKFCKWIDEYKILISWRSLFNSHDCDCPSDYINTDLSPKYYDLPIAFQIGMFQEFMAVEKDDINIKNVKKYIKEDLELINE